MQCIVFLLLSANADDGDCTTAIICSLCGVQSTAAKVHDFKTEWLTDGAKRWHDCKNAGCTVTPSMSRRGNPYDNALAENFFSILKTECIYTMKLETYDEARIIIDQYIYFYNYQRIQLKTKLTPYEKRCQYVD